MGGITTKIKLGILLRCLPMRLWMVLLVFLTLRIVFNLFLIMSVRRCCFNLLLLYYSFSDSTQPRHRESNKFSVRGKNVHN